MATSLPRRSRQRDWPACCWPSTPPGREPEPIRRDSTRFSFRRRPSICSRIQWKRTVTEKSHGCFPPIPGSMSTASKRENDTDLALPAWGYLRLRVRAPNGQPAPAAPLGFRRNTLSASWSPLEVSANSAGIWEGHLPAGPYTVWSWSKDSSFWGRLEMALASVSDQEEVLQLSSPHRSPIGPEKAALFGIKRFE